MRRLGDRPSFLRLVRWGAAGLLCAVALTLSLSSISSYRVVQGALNTVVQGQGDAIMQAVVRATRRGTLTDEEVLRSTFESELPRGLRCVVAFEPGQQSVVAVGSCLTPASALGGLAAKLRLGELSAVGDRVRTLWTPPPAPPPSTPFLSSQGTPPPPGAPWPAGSGSAPGPSWPGPPSEAQLPPSTTAATAATELRLPRTLLVEFAPQMADELRQSAQRTLLFGGAATLALLIAAAIFWQLTIREERAHLTKERQRQLASLGEMAAVLAHELRNPLAALKGHAQLLVEQLPAGSRPRDKATRVVTEAERLEVLSEDLLSFVRTTVIEPQLTSPTDLLIDCAQAIAGDRIELATQQAPARWRVDPLRMRQVLCNLLRNAVEASPADHKVLAGAHVEANELVFSVRDFGKGIPEQDLEKIFEPFYTTRAKGTGLGLPIARRLVTLHGGAITARNAPDGGALFCVRLPEAPPSAA